MLRRSAMVAVSTHGSTLVLAADMASPSGRTGGRGGVCSGTGHLPGRAGAEQGEYRGAVEEPPPAQTGSGQAALPGPGADGGNLHTSKPGHFLHGEEGPGVGRRHARGG